jgi:RNA recognition motif-containing protein
LVIFETKADLNALAYNILFEKTIKVTEKKLHLKLHNKKGNYNPETSICIQQLNYACTESQVIEELNIVLRDDRNKKAASNPEDTSASKNFILSCIIFVDPITRASKQFGFVDFNSAEAANICRKAWNEKSMTHYPNRLNVTMFEPAHVKMTKQEREKTKERQVFTNLYVEKLPYAFTQQDVFDLFSKHGTVLDVKMKKPQSNVALQSVNLLPCAAYVNYKDADQAKAAIKALNGYQVIPGANSLRIDYYQRANKFLGGLLGLDMKELLSNTHWRVLFLRGIHTSVSKKHAKLILNLDYER